MVNRYLKKFIIFKKNGFLLSKGYTHTLSREGINLVI